MLQSPIHRRNLANARYCIRQNQGNTSLQSINIGGELNSWATEKGSRVSNSRGRAVIDAMNLPDVVLLNDGIKPTFNNGRGTYFINVTFVSRLLSANANWRVQEDVTLSDHTLITFSIRTTSPKP